MTARDLYAQNAQFLLMCSDNRNDCYDKTWPVHFELFVWFCGLVAVFDML